MKNIFYLSLTIILISCKTVELTDGTKITKRREKKIFEKAFEDSFGKMPQDEKELLTLTSVEVDTLTLKDSSSVVFSEPFGIAPYTIWTELVPSDGDTTILYPEELFILNGVNYINSDTTIWINKRGVTIYR